MSQTPSYPMYNFETRRAELTNRFQQENAAADYSRWLEEQGFKRQREETSRGFGQMFPRMTGAAAGRLGSQVQSGVFRNQLGKAIQDYQRGLQDIDIASSTAAANFQTQRGLRQSAYERMIQALEAELAQYQSQLANASIVGGGGSGGEQPGDTRSLAEIEASMKVPQMKRRPTAPASGTPNTSISLWRARF